MEITRLKILEIFKLNGCVIGDNIKENFLKEKKENHFYETGIGAGGSFLYTLELIYRVLSYIFKGKDICIFIPQGIDEIDISIVKQFKNGLNKYMYSQSKDIQRSFIYSFNIDKTGIIIKSGQARGLITFIHKDDSDFIFVKNMNHYPDIQTLFDTYKNNFFGVGPFKEGDSFIKTNNIQSEKLIGEGTENIYKYFNGDRKRFKIDFLATE